MATCKIDVLPESLFGSPCARLIRDGRCPVHGDTTQPHFFDHPEPDRDLMVNTLAVLVGVLTKP